MKTTILATATSTASSPDTGPRARLPRPQPQHRQFLRWPHTQRHRRLDPTRKATLTHTRATCSAGTEFTRSTKTHACYPAARLSTRRDCLAMIMRVPRRRRGLRHRSYEVGTVQRHHSAQNASPQSGRKRVVVASGGSTLSASITLTFGGTDALGLRGSSAALTGRSMGPCTTRQATRPGDR